MDDPPEAIPYFLPRFDDHDMALVMQHGHSKCVECIYGYIYIYIYINVSVYMYNCVYIYIYIYVSINILFGHTWVLDCVCDKFRSASHTLVPH